MATAPSSKGSPTSDGAQFASPFEGLSRDLYDEPRPHLHAKTFLALFAVCLLYFAQNYCIVGAGAQANTIAGIFNDAGAASWPTATLAIFTVVLGPIVAQAADCWGRKWLTVACSVLGGVGALVVARAATMGGAIAGFCVTGIAFGAQPLLHAIASEILPRRWRSWGQAALMMATGLGLLLGLLAGGALNRHGDPAGFRYFSYSVMALFWAAAAIVAVAYRPLPLPLQARLSTADKVARLDWAGYALYGSSVVLFCLGLSWSQNPYAWADAHVAAPFAVGVALGGALVVYETAVRKDGLFHHGLFTGNRNFGIALFCIFCEGIAFFAGITYFGFEVGVLYETDPLLVAVRFGITFVTTMVSALLTGWYTTRTRRLRWMTVFAFGVFVVFFACMSTTTRHTATEAWGYPVLLGWALGITIVTLFTAAQLCIPHELIAVASGIMISFRSLGGTIGISIYVAVFNSAMAALGDNVAAAAVTAGLPSSSVADFVAALTADNDTALALVDGVSPQIIGAGANAVLDTYADGFRNIWLSAIGFVALAGLAACFLFDPSKEFNNHIDAPVEKDDALFSNAS